MLPDHTSSAEGKQAHSKDDRSVPPPATPAEPSQAHNYVTNNAATQPLPQNDEWIRGGVIVNAVLVIITMGIAWTGIKQAKAALLNAQNLANSERARMTVDGETMGHSIELNAKNVGRVAAEVTYTLGFTEILPYGEKLPGVPKYIGSEMPVEVEDWVSPGCFINILKDDELRMLVDLSDRAVRDAIRDKKIKLWAYARICYRDGISSVIRETRFCFSVSIRQDGYPLLVRDGPPAYRLEL